MIVCCCTGATEKAVAAGYKEAGTYCGGCLPEVEAIRERNRCWWCGHVSLSKSELLGHRACLDCMEKGWREDFLLEKAVALRREALQKGVAAWQLRQEE